MPHPFPGLFVGIMYFTAVVFLLAPILGRNQAHVSSIRRRATYIWILVTALVVTDYFNGSPHYVALVEKIIVNIATMIIMLGARRVFGEKR